VLQRDGPASALLGRHGNASNEIPLPCPGWAAVNRGRLRTLEALGAAQLAEEA
jgi:hypothetical protein